MLLNIKNIPSHIKPGKVLLWKQIPKNPGNVVGFPINGEEAVVNTDGVSLKTERFMSTCWMLLKTCIDQKGYGIAGPQVLGVSKKVFLIQEDLENYRIYFHPTWSPAENAEILVRVEGCLSVPNKVIEVARFSLINAKWYELDEQGFVLEKKEILNGMKAVAFQHESAHLRGRTILDDSSLTIPLIP